MNFSYVPFNSIANHRDIRFGLGLVQFQKVVREFDSLGLPSVKLGNILTLEYGNSLVEEERAGGDYPVMGSNGVVGYHDEYLVDGPCIVIGRKGSAGEVRYSEKACYPIDTTFYVVLKNEDYDIKFIYYVLRCLRLQRLSLFKGVPGLNRFDVYEVKIPQIDKKIQIEIVKTLEPIEHEIEVLEKGLINPLNAINEAFGSEFGIDYQAISSANDQKFLVKSFKGMAGFETLRTDYKFHRNMPVFDSLLGKIGEYKILKDINLSTPMYGANEAGIDGAPNIDIRFVRITDIDALGNLKADEWKTAENIEEKYLLKSNDFLFARSGNTAGKSFLFNDRLHPESFFAGYFIRFKFDFSEILPLFLLYYTKSFLFEYWRNGIIRIKGQPNINADEFLALKVPILPTERQECIINKIKNEIRKSEQLSRKIEHKRAKIDQMFLDSIMDLA